MAGQTERLLARARERFGVQDYYGTVHLLEEIVDSGRPFADVHHLLGGALSLLGRRERAVQEFARALELNPRYLEALIHQGLVLSELGREAEAEESFRCAAASLAPPPRPAPPRRRMDCRRQWRRAWPTPTPSWPRPTPRRARWDGRSSSISARWSWGPPITICATAWPGACSRPAGRSTPARRWKRCCGSAPDSWMPR